MKIIISYFHIDRISEKMSYLALNPSPINENENDGNYKRQLRNSNNKTIKKKYNNPVQSQTQNSKVSSMMQSMGYASGEHNYDPMEDMSNDEPADFNPPNYAELTKLPNGGEGSIPNSLSTFGQSSSSSNNNMTNQSLMSSNNNNMNTPSNVPVLKESFKGLSYANVPSNSDYETNNAAYVRPYVPYYNTQMTDNTSFEEKRKTKDPLIEKLNYMILLLEEQQNERTDHIMEELILYFFLGIFMIFMVDSFARSGRYVR